MATKISKALLLAMLMLGTSLVMFAPPADAQAAVAYSISFTNVCVSILTNASSMCMLAVSKNSTWNPFISTSFFKLSGGKNQNCLGKTMFSAPWGAETVENMVSGDLGPKKLKNKPFHTFG